MDGVSDNTGADGPFVNKKLMRLSVDARCSTKRSSLLFDNTSPIPSQTETLLRNEEDDSLSGQIRINKFHYSESRFPRMEEMSHFHYNNVEFSGPVKFTLCQEQTPDVESRNSSTFMVEVTSGGKIWVVKRSYTDIVGLDHQIHRCVYDRGYSQLDLLMERSKLEVDTEDLTAKLSQYMTRLTEILGSNMNCGPVLNWFELDNHGNHLVVMEADDSAINVPAIAAAKVIKRYIAQAPDEISLEVNDFISVIDMPPSAETVWWRGKKGLEVGFFPCHCVEILAQKEINDSVIPRSLTVSQRPVSKKRGKFISFLRYFFRSRPSKDELMQTGILRERVFGCDLGEHLNNTQREIPLVLEMCSQIIEEFGIVDGIYRLSGITSNMQKLRVAFDNEEPPTLTDPKYLNDVHCISSLLKTYFRELPNPLLTYELYDRFVGAMSNDDNTERTIAFHHALQRLPPPHYRTLEYLLRHLSKVASYHGETNMNEKNLAIVWSPNLLKPNVQEYGQRILSEIRVQALILEYLLKNVDLFFDKNIASAAIAYYPEVGSEIPPSAEGDGMQIQADARETWMSENIAISNTPPKLISLEEARARLKENKSAAANGVTLDTEDGAPEKIRHKVRSQIEPPHLASFPVSEGPSLLSLEEAQARNRTRSAKIPRRGSVDLAEYRLKAEKEGVLLPPSPSPKKRIWKALFARSKSTNEYNEATANIPKSSTLSTYRKRLDSRSPPLQPRSFSSYSLGDYVRTGGSIFDNLTVTFSNKSKKLEISEPIPHRTESFTSYVGGGDLFYLDPQPRESISDSKPPVKPHIKEQKSVDKTGISPKIERRRNPFVKHSSLDEGDMKRKKDKKSQVGEPGATPSMGTRPESLPVMDADMQETTILRSATNPIRGSRRREPAVEKTEDEPIWIRASQHYQVELLPRNSSYYDKKSEPVSVSSPDMVHLNNSSSIQSHSETDVEAKSFHSQSSELIPSPPLMRTLSHSETVESTQPLSRTKSQLVAKSMPSKPLSRSLSEGGARNDELVIVPLNSNPQFNSTSESNKPQGATEDLDDIKHDESGDSSVFGVDDDNKISMTSSKGYIHDRLVQRTSSEGSEHLKVEEPDSLSASSTPCPSNNARTLTFICTSELPKPQVPIRPNSDGLVKETVAYLNEYEKHNFRPTNRGFISKRHSIGGVAVAPTYWKSGPRVARCESIASGGFSSTNLSPISGLQGNSNKENNESQWSMSPKTQNRAKIASTGSVVNRGSSVLFSQGGEVPQYRMEERLSQPSRTRSLTLEPEVPKEKDKKIDNRSDVYRDDESQKVRVLRSDPSELEGRQARFEKALSENKRRLSESVPRTAVQLRNINISPRGVQRPLSEITPNHVSAKDKVGKSPSDTNIHNGVNSKNNVLSKTYSVSTGSTMPSLNLKSSDGLVFSTLRRPGFSADVVKAAMTPKEGEIRTHEDRKDASSPVTDISRSNRESKSVSFHGKLDQGDSPIKTSPSRSNTQLSDRSRQIRNNLMSRGSRELESHSTGTRSPLHKKAVSSDDVSNLKEGNFLRRALGEPFDPFASDNRITARKINIEDNIDKKEIPVDAGSVEPHSITDNQLETEGKHLTKDNKNSSSFDWVPIMQKSLSAGFTSERQRPGLNLSNTDDPDSYPFPTERRPSAYDNVEVKRASFYDNLKVDDV